MLNFHNRIISVLTAAAIQAFTSLAVASPAWRGMLSVTEPDGTQISLRLQGDEYFNCLITPDGYPVAKGEDGFHYLRDSAFRPTYLRAAHATSPEVSALKKSFDPGVILRKALLSAEARRSVAPKAGRFPAAGNPHTLVLLVQFADETFSSSDPWSDYNLMLNAENYTENGATGSCRRFYADNSMGRFNPTFDLYGPVTLAHGFRYYGENNPLTGADSRASDMVIEACQALDDQIDFSVYDTDHDGVIDNVYVFYAGYGAADSGLSERIWPHSYDFTSDERRVFLDGKRLGNYACSNELNFHTGQMTGIGTFVHEFGHCLGLPDMYNTRQQSASFTPGEWDFMDYGMYNNQMRTPPCVTAYERFFLGWMEPVELDRPDNITLGHIAENVAYRVSTNLPDEYFLLENRQPVGWDAYIPGHGMLVWHIDYVKSVWDENLVNANPAHQYVDILEADNIRNLDNIHGDPFPGTAGVTEITDDTQPGMRTWLGLGFGKTITAISEDADGIISFRYRGGTSLAGPPASVEVSEVTPTSFKASWDAVEGASHYIVNLVECTGGMPFGRYGECHVGDVTDFIFSGLDPDTEYRLWVKAADSYSVTDPSAEVYVNTLPPTFDLIVPPAPVVAATGPGYAMLRLEEVPGADAYHLEVYSKERSEAQVKEFLDFSDGAALPDGWLSTSSSTISISGYFGEASPALVLAADGGYVQTPHYDDQVSALSFWTRGRGDVAGNTVRILGHDGRRWRLLTETEAPSGPATMRVDPDMLEESHSVRIIYCKSAAPGNIIIDDIAVEAGATVTRLYAEGFRSRVLTAAGEVRVGPLEDGMAYYAAYTAAAGAATTLVSPETRFVATAAGVEMPGTPDRSSLTWRADAGIITVFCVPSISQAAIFNAAGVCVARATVSPDGVARFPALTPGFYMVRAGHLSAKIILE